MYKFRLITSIDVIHFKNQYFQILPHDSIDWKSIRIEAQQDAFGSESSMRWPSSSIPPTRNKNRLHACMDRADRSVYERCPSWYDGKGRHLLFRLLSTRFRDAFVPRIAPLLSRENHLRPYRWLFNIRWFVIMYNNYARVKFKIFNNKVEVKSIEWKFFFLQVIIYSSASR